MAGATELELQQLSEELDRLGASGSQKSAILRLAGEVGVDAPNVSAAIQNMQSYQEGQATKAADQALYDERLALFGGDDARLGAFESAFGANFTTDALSQLAPTANAVFDQVGVTDAGKNALREIAGLDPVAYAQDTGRIDTTTAAQDEANTNSFLGFFGQPTGDNPETGAGATARPGGLQREIVGTIQYGQTTQIVETDEYGNYFINGRQANMDDRYDRGAVQSAIKNGPQGDGTGVGGRSGGGSAAPRLSFLGQDPRTGEALSFNPVTGQVVRGEVIGYKEQDPILAAREDARRFNEQQALSEGEFLRDVLSNGRNFLTAALLSRGGREGFTTGLDQTDILNAGGFAGYGQSGGVAGTGTGQLTGLTGDERANVPDWVEAGLAAQGGTQANPGIGSIGSGGGSSFDPRFTTVAPGGARSGGNGTATGTQLGSGPVTLADLARMTAPPAVQDISRGMEVGSLSTPSAGTGTPLASPTTLNNLTGDEAGALDTFLQNTDQRTLADYAKESQQRFLGQGSRAATRA